VQVSSPASKMQAGTLALCPMDGLLRHPPERWAGNGRPVFP